VIVTGIAHAFEPLQICLVVFPADIRVGQVFVEARADAMHAIERRRDVTVAAYRYLQIPLRMLAHQADLPPDPSQWQPGRLREIHRHACIRKHDDGRARENPALSIERLPSIAHATQRSDLAPI